MLNVRVEAPLLRDVLGRFRRVDEVAQEELNSAVRQATEAVYRQVRRNIRSTFRTSGRMESALQMLVRPGKRPVGEVFIEGLRYAIHERGGAKSYTIFPRNGQALKFQGLLQTVTGDARFGGVFARRVDRDPLPQRSYLRRALDEKRDEIREIFGDATKRIAERTVRG